MKGTTTIRREGVLLTVSAQLCTLGKESEITSHSWMFPDTDRSHERVIVIWINEVLLAVSSNGMLQFIVAREMARYEEGRMCSMSGIPEYLPCEHQLDRFATRIVGMEAALQSLETMHVTLTLSGSRTFVLMHMGRRIQMLREYKEQLAQPKDSNQDNDLAQPDPQEDTG